MLRNLSTVGKKICQMNARNNIRSTVVSSSIGNMKQFSSLLDSKERGDENRFFREEEERNKAAIRAKFEKLLAEQHGAEQQQEILEILGKYK